MKSIGFKSFKNLFIGFFFLIIFFTTSFVFKTYAIEQTPNVSEASDIFMQLSPQNPAPGDSVIITLSSYSQDLNSDMIYWFVNGRNTTSGIGKKSITVSSPDAGSETSVVAQITLPGNIKSEVKTSISPARMTLLWEAYDSYVPPFYKGKALMPPGTWIKAVAIPEIIIGSKTIKPENMVYNWQQDYINIQGGSGYGKDYYLYKDNLFKSSTNIEVSSATTDGKNSSTGNVSVETTNPQLSFYKEDDKLGIMWNNALTGNYKMKEGQVMIVAAPYFISPSSIKDPSLTFRWYINNSLVSLPNDNKTIMPLKIVEGTTGTAVLSLKINSSNNLTQNASKEINVNF